MSDHIEIVPHPHTLRCPGCGSTRDLPDGWQGLLGSDTLSCVACGLVMLAVES